MVFILDIVLNVENYLKEQKQLIALGSASKNARPILEKTGILSYFDAIVDGNDVTNAKPDPEVFLIAAKLLDIKPENSIVFEDSVAGIQAANIGGMVSVGIGEASTLHEAKYIFKDFTEIDKIDDIEVTLLLTIDPKDKEDRRLQCVFEIHCAYIKYPPTVGRSGVV